jgi:hypothetical protein|tara:strand:+ start:1881 stop:2120 length:240 start_codon:yes stop_codon:yes gene_type:complete
VKQSKKIRYRGGPSELLDSIIFSGYEIKSLKHGNTRHTLYKFPSKTHDWEECWTMDLHTAKTGILKYQQHLKTGDKKKE